jgi:hypothetical protein
LSWLNLPGVRWCPWLPGTCRGLSFAYRSSILRRRRASASTIPDLSRLPSTRPVGCSPARRSPAGTPYRTNELDAPGRTARLRPGCRWTGQIRSPSHPPCPAPIAAFPPSRSQSAPARSRTPRPEPPRARLAVRRAAQDPEPGSVFASRSCGLACPWLRPLGPRLAPARGAIHSTVRISWAGWIVAHRWHNVTAQGRGIVSHWPVRNRQDIGIVGEGTG